MRKKSKNVDVTDVDGFDIAEVDGPDVSAELDSLMDAGNVGTGLPAESVVSKKKMLKARGIEPKEAEPIPTIGSSPATEPKTKRKSVVIGEKPRPKSVTIEPKSKSKSGTPKVPRKKREPGYRFNEQLKGLIATVDPVELGKGLRERMDKAAAKAVKAEKAAA